MTPADVYGEGVLAEYSSTCPVCSNYVRAGRSRIAPLPVPLPLDPASLTCRRGTFFDRGGHAVRPTARAWCHAECLRRLPESADELAELAEERRMNLADLKAESKPRKGGRR